MKKYLFSIVSTVAIVLTLSSFNSSSKKNVFKSKVISDTIKNVIKDTVLITDIKIEEENLGKVILFKENAHASYYHDKFNGRRTASGKRFNNNELTAAHKKLPFGTKLRITNPKNKKSVIVTITDRGPFVKGREIDLSKKAFKEISHKKGAGVLMVKIEKIAKNS